MFQFLNNLPPVTKNLLLINVLLFIITFVLESKGINLTQMLGEHYVTSPLFKPYQLVTNFFMHGSITHILFNMLGLTMFGSLLEKLWGPKRFFIFYVASALGASVLYNSIGAYHLWEVKNQLISSGYSITEINYFLTDNVPFNYNVEDTVLINEYVGLSLSNSVGASGAIFGIMAAFAFLFPNTELMLLFIPFPIKAKYLVGGYFLIEVYLSFNRIEGDNISHLSHVGGAVVGFILVYIWNRNKKTFY